MGMKATSAVLGATVGVGMAVATCSASAATFVVSYEGEAPGVETTTATFSQSGVEAFDNVSGGKTVFFDTTGSFSAIVFRENPAVGGSESDNHTVGHYLTMGQGMVIPLLYSTSAPEPSTYAMMLLGFAGLGFAAYHRRKKVIEQL